MGAAASVNLTPAEVAQWTPQQVDEYLQQTPFYEATRPLAVVERNITGQQFIGLDAATLESLGMDEASRTQLLQHLQRFQPPTFVPDGEEVTLIVLDQGTYVTRVGFAGEDAPRGVFPSIVGRPQNAEVHMPGMGQKDAYVGDEAVAKRGVLTLTKAIENGAITNWDDVEKIWHHGIFNELRISPEESAALIVEPPLNPKADRERMLQMAFETFNFEAVFIAPAAVLELMASGRTTGVVVDFGEHCTNVMVINNGTPVHGGTVRAPYGGADVTDRLARLLEVRGYAIDPDVVTRVKEAVCFVSQNFDTQTGTGEMQTSFEATSGDTITLDEERFNSTEGLFRPSMFSKEAVGVHEVVASAIQAALANTNQAGLQEELWRNIVLAGGTSQIEGMASRLQAELQAQAPAGAEVHVHAPDGRNMSSWVGGSIVASLTDMAHMWVSKQEYHSEGPAVVHRKCFGEVL